MCGIAVRRAWPERLIRISRELPWTRGYGSPHNRWFGYLLLYRGAYLICFAHYDGSRATVPATFHSVASFARGKAILSQVVNDFVSAHAPAALHELRGGQVNYDWRRLMQLADAEFERARVGCPTLDRHDKLNYLKGMPVLRVTYELEAGGFVAVRVALTGISTPTIRMYFLSSRAAADAFCDAPPTRIFCRIQGHEHPSLAEMWDAVHRPQAPTRESSTYDDAVMYPDEEATTPAPHVRHRSVSLDAIANTPLSPPASRVRWLAVDEASLYTTAATLAAYHYGDDFFWVLKNENSAGCVIMSKDGDAIATYPSFPSRDELGHDLAMAGWLHD